MPTFNITGPDGKKYRVTGENAEGALGALRKSLGTTSGPSKEAMSFDPGVPGYNSKTGLVEKTGMEKDADRVGAFATNAIEGMPIVGPSFSNVAADAAAGIASLTSGQPFSDVRQQMVDRREQVSGEHPQAAMAGNVTGGVLGTAPLVVAAPGLFGGGGFVPTLIKGALSGGAIGGGDAAVRSGGDPWETAKGAGIGAGLGIAAPVAGRVIGAGVGKLAERLGGPRMNTAERLLGRAAIADDVADDFAGAMERAGPDAMPMDLGPNLRQQAGAIAATPGPGQRVVRDAIERRAAGAGERIASSLDDALGQNVDTLALADDIIAKRGEAAKPLYDAAYSKPIPFTRDLEELLTRPSVGKALKAAQNLAADEGIPSQQWFAGISDDGSVAIKRVPDMRQLDLTKRSLDDMISAAQRSGNNNEARILTQTKNKLVQMMDTAVPEYAQARAAFSGPTQVIDALEEGKNAFRNNVTPAQLQRQLAQMGEAEREAFIQGARAQIADTMGTARNDALSARSVFQKGYNREKLAMLVGADEAERLVGSLDREARFAGTRDVVSRNSETAARQAAQSEIGGAKTEWGVKEAANLQFGTAASRMADKIFGGARSAARDATNAELARLLTGPESVSRKVQLLQAAQRRGDLTADATKKAIQSLVISGGTNDRKRMELTVTKGRH